MFHLANASIGLLLIGLTSLAPTTSASTLSDLRADSCEVIFTEGHMVADRLDRQMARCEQARGGVTDGPSVLPSDPNAVRIACIHWARADGWRPADRIERSILACVRNADR